MDIHEIIGEKIRATAQRSRIRDLFDLYQFCALKFDRDLVRRLAIIKCWETNYALDPATFLSNLPIRRYDWADLSRLVKRGKAPFPEIIIGEIQREYQFLTKMDPDEQILSIDIYRRERDSYLALLAKCGTAA